MDHADVLFVRDCEIIKQESVQPEDDDNIWDDGLLIKAYEHAISLSKDKVPSKAQSGINEKLSNKKESKVNTKKKEVVEPVQSSDSKWKVGMSCSCVYSEDGEVYEATIIKMMQWKGTCIVRYLGYNNEEEVYISDLLKTNGEQARKQQLLQVREADEDTDTSQASMMKNILSKQKDLTYLEGFANTIPPPPPPQFVSDGPKSEAEALSSMLMSWYMSGYHTGYYMGLKNQAKGCTVKCCKK